MNTEQFRQLCTEKNFDAEQIHEFELAISHGLNISPLIKQQFSSKCMHEIILGMIHHVDTSIYAKNTYI